MDFELMKKWLAHFNKVSAYRKHIRKVTHSWLDEGDLGLANLTVFLLGAMFQYLIIQHSSWFYRNVYH